MAPHSDISLAVRHPRRTPWKERVTTFGSLSLRALECWVIDRALSMGASLAFYTIFSMAPLLLIAISIAGFFFGNDVAREAVVDEFRLLAGASAAHSVDVMLISASHFGSGILGVTIGLCTFLVSATAAFIELQDDLNAILRAPPPQISKYWTFLRQRVISLAMIVAIGFLLMVSLAFDAAISAFGHYFQLDVIAVVLAILTFLVNAMMSILLFALIFKVLPNADLSWRAVLGGAVFTATLFIIGKFLIGFYLGQSHVASTYGAAASLITILLWVYYSSQILLIGAEFIAAFTGRREPDGTAQRHRASAHEGRRAIRARQGTTAFPSTSYLVRPSDNSSRPGNKQSERDDVKGGENSKTGRAKKSGRLAVKKTGVAAGCRFVLRCGAAFRRCRPHLRDRQFTRPHPTSLANGFPFS